MQRVFVRGRPGSVSGPKLAFSELPFWLATVVALAFLAL
jgi:hypothetical protein